jgi:hypothetical protein
MLMLPIKMDGHRWLLLRTKVTNVHSCIGPPPPHAPSGYHAICRALLAHGANVNLENLEGISALGWAAEQGHIEVETQMLFLAFITTPIFHAGSARAVRIWRQRCRLQWLALHPFSRRTRPRPSEIEVEPVASGHSTRFRLFPCSFTTAAAPIQSVLADGLRFKYCQFPPVELSNASFWAGGVREWPSRSCEATHIKTRRDRGENQFFTPVKV